MPLEWLKPRKTVKGMRYRRTLADKGPRIEPEEILRMIQSQHWPYAPNEYRRFYELRDNALICLEYVCCGRVGEVLDLEKEQFENQPHFLIINNYHVEKNKQNPIRDPWAVAKEGRLGPFTEIIQAYLKQIPEHQHKLFNFKRSRAYQIAKLKGAKWNHWFRAMGEAFFMRYVFKEPVKCASALRLRRSDTLIEYVPYVWQDYEKELSS